MDIRDVARLADVSVATVSRVLAANPNARLPTQARVTGALAELGFAATDQVGVIWDLLHPWRVGEDPATTWSHLGEWLVGGRGYVQIKDVASRTDLTPMLQGEGVVPLAEASDILITGGYLGPLSLEWERTWYPDVPPLAVALPAAARAVCALGSGAHRATVMTDGSSGRTRPSPR